MKKTYVAMIRDHSASMRGLSKDAMNDYNNILREVKNSGSPDHELFLTTIKCGTSKFYETEHNNEPIKNVFTLNQYNTDGSSTPLYDSVGRGLEILEGILISEFNKKEDDVAFLMMVITDGQENSSRNYSATSLSEKINRLQATDKFTFTFRVPKGQKKYIQNRLNIPDGNIIEWGYSSEELIHSTQQTVSGIQEYFNLRSSGVTSTTRFYSDLTNVKVSDIQAVMKDNSSDYLLSKVRPENNEISIKQFCLNNFGNYKIGNAFYELTKTETVQQQKQIVIRDKLTGDIYSGTSARTLLNLPYTGSIRLTPGRHGNYDVFIQSTSVNRKLYVGNSVLYRI